MSLHPYTPAGISGTLYFDQQYSELIRYFSELFRTLAIKYGAQENSYPSIISQATLARFEFFKSFPELAHNVEITPKDSKQEMLLSTAVCYHCYIYLQNTELLASGKVITACGKCFRNEQAYSGNPQRLREFTMREIIFFGTKDHCDTTKQKLMKDVLKLALLHNLVCDFELATDPFYKLQKGSQLYQRLKGLKHELVSKGSGSEGLALASANLHEQFFTKKCNITLKGGECYSGCVAFGLERWVEVFIQRNGSIAKHWPDTVRKNL